MTNRSHNRSSGPARKTVDITRRHVLRGTGGFTLGLPFLPSLLPREALGAGDPTFIRQPRFVAMSTEHGGVDGVNMYPADSTLTNTVTLHPGHEVRQGVLTRKVDGASAQLSPVLRGPANQLSDRLVSKMNVLRGFDVPHDIGHNVGGHLGNFARCDQGPGGVDIKETITIDQLMAWSPSFYKNLGGVKQRAVATGQDFRGISWGYSNPAARSGTVQKVSVESSSKALFNKLFVPSAPAGTEPAPRKPIVDLILANYRSLRQSNRRLSAADRSRLDDHVARLSELQRTMSVSTPKSCGTIPTPTQDSSGFNSEVGSTATKFFQLINDVIVAAFACGTCSVFTMCVLAKWADFSGSWHQDIAHNCGQPGPQQLLTGSLQGTFSNVFLDLAVKLDVEEAPGMTYLDNTLVMWTQESGQETHDSHSNPVVTAGSAAGFFKTGNYCDYRNRAVKWRTSKPEFMGITHRQWLANVLTAMGIPRSEFETGGQPGYGDAYVDDEHRRLVKPEVFSKASDILPFIKA